MTHSQHQKKCLDKGGALQLTRIVLPLTITLYGKTGEERILAKLKSHAIGFKNILRQLGWARSLNARVRAYKTRKEYVDTVQYYAAKRQLNNLADKVPKTIPSRNSLAHDKPRVFFLGTDEDQDKSGIIQCLERLCELTCFIRSDGSYGQNYPGSDVERRRANSERLLELFAGLESVGTPDLLIGQTWAGYIDPRVLGDIKSRYGTFIINIGMDDRHQYWGRKVDGEWWGTRGLIPYLDLALTAAPECVEWYEKEGCPALFFPEASDPDIFHPMPELPKIHDVCFVGGRYGVREKIVNALRNAGINVTAYGFGWEGGRLDTKDVPRLFAQSKIVLGVGTIGHCEDFYALKMRDFDGPMSGSCYVTHDNPDLRLVYKIGEEIVTYRTANECVDKIRWCLSHEDERERIAAAGRARAFVNHTWEKRFCALFDFLGIPVRQ